MRADPTAATLADRRDSGASGFSATKRMRVPTRVSHAAAVRSRTGGNGMDRFFHRRDDAFGLRQKDSSPCRTA
jgi:hypothetical protein